MILITQPKAGRLHNESLAIQMMAKELGYEVYNADQSWRLPDNVTSKESMGVPYGSQTFCEVIAQQMNWKLIGNDHNWLSLLPREFLKREVNFYTFGQIKNMHFGEDMFIKSADYKLFTAKVYAPDEFQPPEAIDDDTPILVSDPVEFTEEYRCFVDAKKCKTVSCYLYHGEINEPKNWYNENCDKAAAFVESAISHLALLGTETVPSVIDVGIIKDKGFAIIESNQAWASGIYGCDPYSVLKVLELSCKTL